MHLGNGSPSGLVRLNTVVLAFVPATPEERTMHVHQSVQSTLLSPREVAEVARVDIDTVYRAIKSGLLPARRVGRQWRIEREHVLAGWVR